ncbi:hypothetical protein LTR04_000906 [Oleoguttula sp. CCFEE 6159]|nr:hypothetical protein LTR04_000906 [Oleoguttula sp. CCFEE 6159]
MTTRDVRDMLDLPSAGLSVPPPKRQKTVERKAQAKGIARELLSLQGDRDAPLLIQQTSQFKSKPKHRHRAAKYELTPFVNSARTDGLILRHWLKKEEARPLEDTDVKDAPDGEIQEQKLETEYRYSRYNTQIDVPTYDEATYNTHLQDPDWTKEETDYLVDLVKEYYRKWAVVVDRYDFQLRTATGQQATPPPSTRSMEDIKARYYAISAKVLSLHTPISSMTAPEFSLYEILTKFDPERETRRKELAELHLNRRRSEVEEEKTLLEELQRITLHQSKMQAERKEIRERLGYPHSTSTGTALQYSSSHALGQLFSQLLAADRNKKVRRLQDMNTNSPNTNGAITQNQGSASAARDSTHRESISAQPKRSSTANLALSSDTSRIFSSEDEERFGVSTPDERLTSGVTFRSDKIAKLRQAKSTIQSQKIAATLAHLKIPEYIVLPSRPVHDEFEKLVGKINLLLDARKVAEKEEHEMKVAAAMKEEKERRERRERGEASPEPSEPPEEVSTLPTADDVDMGDGSTADPPATGIKQESQAEAEQEQPQGQKRSASVLSAASIQSNKRMKK